MNTIRLGDCDFRFMSLVWDNEPVKSGDLVKLCEAELGWKKSTTYTTIKKLSEKGLLKNDAAVVTSLVSKEAIQKVESEHFVERTFQGSLPQFVAAFLGGRTLSDWEIKEIEALLQKHKEG